MAAAVDRAGAEDVVAQLVTGLETQLGPSWPGGVDISFGQWQKLALARGFMRERPLVLVLDEPTASLDAETEHALFERFAAAARAGRVGATGASAPDRRITLLVSHSSARSAWPTSSQSSMAHEWWSRAPTKHSWPSAGDTRSCMPSRLRPTAEVCETAHSQPTDLDFCAEASGAASVNLPCGTRRWTRPFRVPLLQGHPLQQQWCFPRIAPFLNLWGAPATSAAIHRLA